MCIMMYLLHIDLQGRSSSGPVPGDRARQVLPGEEGEQNIRLIDAVGSSSSSGGGGGGGGGSSSICRTWWRSTPCDDLAANGGSGGGGGGGGGGDATDLVADYIRRRSCKESGFGVAGGTDGNGGVARRHGA